MAAAFILSCPFHSRNCYSFVRGTRARRCPPPVNSNYAHESPAAADGPTRCHSVHSPYELMEEQPRIFMYSRMQSTHPSVPILAEFRIRS